MFTGGELRGKNSTLLRNQNKKERKEKLKSFFSFALFIFAYFYGKRTFCLVDRTQRLDCLWMSFTWFLRADGGNGQNKAPFICHSYWCFRFQEHSGQIPSQSVQQGSCPRIQPHAENCERRREGKCPCSIFTWILWVEPSLLLALVPCVITPKHQIWGVLTALLVW